MRLIDADELKELFREVIGGIAKKPEIQKDLEHMVRASAMTIQMIDDAPTIEAEPVIHAKWIFSHEHSEGACTNCNFKIYGRPYYNTYLIVPYNYCPNCGAKMEVDDGLN